MLENDLEQDSSDFVMKKKKTPFTIQFHSLVDTISLVKADGKIHVFWGVVIIGEATSSAQRIMIHYSITSKLLNFRRTPQTVYLLH